MKKTRFFFQQSLGFRLVFGVSVTFPFEMHQPSTIVTIWIGPWVAAFYWLEIPIDRT